VSLIVAAPARATFHDADIYEVIAGHEMDPLAQYVEIRMRSSGQQFVKATRLAAFDNTGNFIAVLLEVPADVCNDGAEMRWSMGTPTFAATTGVTPDFLWDPVVAGMLGTSLGTVCWGAPGTSAEDPPMWAASNAANYTDCITYGEGATAPAGAPTDVTPQPPGDGNMQSLNRTTTPTFILANATPTNNGCGSTTTTTSTLPGASTTTVPGGTATTTTLPLGPGQLLSGTRLLLKTPTNATKRSLSLTARDPAITLGDGNGSDDDPTVASGSLRVVSTAGDGFDDTYPLAAAGWKRLGRAGANKGYRFGPGAGVKVRVKSGKLLKIVAKGPALGHSLGADPNPIDVVLTTGTERFCLRFGGTVTFVPGKRFLATNAPAPGSCPP
jgi:hypothetical protein